VKKSDNIKIVETECNNFSYKVLIKSSQKVAPRVSIMIPTFRRPLLLNEAIQSALNQKTNIIYNIIVIDNNSEIDNDDKVLKLMQEISSDKITLIRNCRNIGMYANWNQCIRLSQAPWLTILNDDDILLTNFVEESYKRVKSADSIMMVAGRIALHNQIKIGVLNRFLENLISFLKSILFNRSNQNDLLMNLSRYYVSNPHYGSLGILFNRDCAIKLGGFDKNYFPSADYRFWVDFAKRYPCVQISTVVGRYRIAVNECLKDEVLIGWLRQGREIRASIKEYIDLSPGIQRIYETLVPYIFVHSVKRRFGKDINLQEYALKSGVFGFLLYLSGLLVRFYIKIRLSSNAR
jgi:glycosyltransferase